MSNVEVGLKSGELTVIGDAPDRVTENGGCYKMCTVQCSCGRVYVNYYRSIVKQISKICSNCSRKASKNKVHGMSSTGAYNSYKRMLERTTNPNHPSYDKYGGAGIVVEESSWLEPQPSGFLNFYKDMGDRPEGSTLDRVDNDLGYFKDNCRWATRSEQQLNRRNLAPRSKNGSKFRGVYHAPTAWAMKFDTGDSINAPVINMSFDTEIEAATAYDNLYEKYYGQRPNATDRKIVYPKFKPNGYVRAVRKKFSVVANIDGKPTTIKGKFETRLAAEEFLKLFIEEQYNSRQGVTWL